MPHKKQNGPSSKGGPFSLLCLRALHAAAGRVDARLLVGGREGRFGPGEARRIERGLGLVGRGDEELERGGEQGDEGEGTHELLHKVANSAIEDVPTARPNFGAFAPSKTRKDIIKKRFCQCLQESDN